MNIQTYGYYNNIYIQFGNSNEPKPDRDLNIQVLQRLRSLPNSSMARRIIQDEFQVPSQSHLACIIRIFILLVRKW